MPIAEGSIAMAFPNSTTLKSLPLLRDAPLLNHLTSTPWILHHLLECNLVTELPLRIMFSFNAGMVSSSWALSLIVPGFFADDRVKGTNYLRSNKPRAGGIETRKARL